jgi:hypothetical protein
MANQFLVEIHNHISRIIEADLKDRDNARDRDDENRLFYLDGKLSELRLIRAYLSDHFDLNTQRYY